MAGEALNILENFGVERSQQIPLNHLLIGFSSYALPINALEACGIVPDFILYFFTPVKSGALRGFNSPVSSVNSQMRLQQMPTEAYR